MPSLEDLIGKIMSLVDRSQSGTNNYWGGTSSNASRRQDYLDQQARVTNANEYQKQQDLNSNNQANREQAMTLAGLQYGPGGSADRGYQSNQAVANTGLEGHKYTADKGLAGQQLQADTTMRGQDKTLESASMQYGPGGSSDRRDALQFQKLTPEAQRAQHASDIAGRLAATGAPPDQVREMYQSLSAAPVDFSALNPTRQQGAAGQAASPYVFQDGTVEKTVSSQQPVSLQQQAMAAQPIQTPSIPQAEKQPGFIDALKYSNQQLGGKLLDPLDLNKKKKSTNPLFPNYEN